MPGLGEFRDSGAGVTLFDHAGHAGAVGGRGGKIDGGKGGEALICILHHAREVEFDEVAAITGGGPGRRAFDDVQQGYGRAKVLRHGPDMRDRSVAACGEIYREEDVAESHGESPFSPMGRARWMPIPGRVCLRGLEGDCAMWRRTLPGGCAIPDRAREGGVARIPNLRGGRSVF